MSAEGEGQRDRRERGWYRGMMGQTLAKQTEPPRALKSEKACISELAELDRPAGATTFSELGERNQVLADAFYRDCGSSNLGALNFDLFDVGSNVLLRSWPPASCASVKKPGDPSTHPQLL